MKQWTRVLTLESRTTYVPLATKNGKYNGRRGFVGLRIPAFDISQETAAALDLKDGDTIAITIEKLG